MQTERKYGFRQVLNTIHRPDRRDVAARPRPDELEITGGWRIILTCGNAPLPEKVARDLQDYFFTSMNVSLLLEKKNAPSDRNDPKCLLLGTKTEFPILGCELTVPGSYILEVTADRIVLCGCDARGLAQGCFYLEDLMNLREAPFLPTGRQRREPLFSPRMVHSGWGIDQFPDAHLNAIAHAGMDAILVFAKDVDTTTMGYLDFNDLIERAAGFGLDVYLYSYLKSRKHPAEKDAREYYDSTYGKLFKACPGAKGVILVGESCEFPSRDTVNTTGRLWEPSRDGIRAEKPSPGWWPCFDYPEWLAMIRDTVRRYNPDADIVFWTYNWGYAPETERLRLIESLPTDITLMATFEMFEPLRRDHATGVCTDYTISFAGPGRYFAGEAAAAAKCNIRLYTMSNTAGRTWDFGTVPFIPVPFQWGVRHRALRKARCDWGLSGLMESHHYGFSPSCVSELAKWNFWSPEVPEDEIMTRIAVRDFGAAGAAPALAAWRLWSEAITLFTPTNEDMYGPCRVGPSYPMIFHPDITRTFESQEIAMPSVPHAHFGHRIVMTFYRPFENEQQSPGGVRFPGEIAALEKMLELWREGDRLMEQAAELAPPSKHPEALRMAGLGRYIAHNLVTAIHMKKWWLLNKRLLLESNPDRAIGLLGEIEALARAEIVNAAAAIPLVEADSRLGWEPSMEYMTDREHLEWKIRQVQTVIDVAIPTYKKMLRLGGTPDKASSAAFRKGN